MTRLLALTLLGLGMLAPAALPAAAQELRFGRDGPSIVLPERERDRERRLRSERELERPGRGYRERERFSGRDDGNRFGERCRTITIRERLPNGDVDIRRERRCS